jgi:hypothetical protein
VPGARDGVCTIAGALTPERNLALQTRVISGARAFIGTYGGYAYLAPFHGVPALAFYSAPTFRRHHLHLAQQVFAQLGAATVDALDVAHAPLLQMALAAGAGSHP